jgi:hypothetical protein
MQIVFFFPSLYSIDTLSKKGENLLDDSFMTSFFNDLSVRFIYYMSKCIVQMNYKRVHRRRDGVDGEGLGTSRRNKT